MGDGRHGPAAIASRQCETPMFTSTTRQPRARFTAGSDTSVVDVAGSVSTLVETSSSEREPLPERLGHADVPDTREERGSRR